MCTHTCVHRTEGLLLVLDFLSVAGELPGRKGDALTPVAWALLLHTAFHNILSMFQDKGTVSPLHRGGN